MTIVVDATGLTAAAGQLTSSTQVHSPAVAEPPGLDLTSVSAVAQINAASTALAGLLNHGSALREVGAMAVAGTASTLSGQDEANASAILNGSSPSGASSSAPTLPSVPMPSVPSLPSFPAALAPLPGEAHSQALYGGPGSSSLHSFADQWASHAQQLREQASTITSTGHAIDASWDDGHQRAGANTRTHGEWLNTMADHAEKLSTHARTVAQSFETAKANTPSPQEFQQAHQELQQAMQRFNASRGANAPEVQMRMQDIAQKQTQATSSATNYHAQVSEGNLSSTGESLKTAPPIAGGSGTLWNRYVDTPSAGYLRAKTGSLTGTNALARVGTDQSGRVLTFALISNNAGPEGRTALDALAAAFRSCGCGS